MTQEEKNEAHQALVTAALETISEQLEHSRVTVERLQNTVTNQSFLVGLLLAEAVRENDDPKASLGRVEGYLLDLTKKVRAGLIDKENGDTLTSIHVTAIATMEHDFAKAVSGARAALGVEQL